MAPTCGAAAGGRSRRVFAAELVPSKQKEINAAKQIVGSFVPMLGEWGAPHADDGDAILDTVASHGVLSFRTRN